MAFEPQCGWKADGRKEGQKGEFPSLTVLWELLAQAAVVLRLSCFSRRVALSESLLCSVCTRAVVWMQNFLSYNSL